MASIDTRLHELEARVAALEWWKSFHIEQRHAGEAGGPEPAASPAPAQAAQPPCPLGGDGEPGCEICHREPCPARLRPYSLTAAGMASPPDPEEQAARPAPQQPLGPGLAELGACEHEWEHEAMAVDGDYYRCPKCNAHKLELRQPRGGGG